MAWSEEYYPDDTLPLLPPRVQILHIRSGWRLTSPPSLWRLPCYGHSERRQECFVEKTGNGMITRSEESMALMTSYCFPHHSGRWFPDVQDDTFRFPSLWCFPFPITSDVLSQNRHSERTQKCCVRKPGKRSCDTKWRLMTVYRLPHHGNRSFACARIIK